jgi:hypothetical protein
VATTSGRPLPTASSDGKIITAFVIGEPVSVIEFDYDDIPRRGLTARCRREDGAEYVVAAADVTPASHVGGARVLAAYRAWLGIAPERTQAEAPSGRVRRHKAAPSDIDMTRPVELVVLAAREKGSHCRLLGTDRVVTLRAGSPWLLVPGEIAVVKPRKYWSYAGHPHLSGEILSTRLDVPALGLLPLKLRDWDTWDPDEHYWGEEGEAVEQWAKPIIARGSRPAFKMEQVLPGSDPTGFGSDPTREAVETWESGDHAAAERILMDLCKADLRCLDAHAHLGSFAFDHRPKDAMRHYEVGVRIGELSLPEGFDGLLPWGRIDNRPFMRCLHGYGLCLWRSERFEEAERVFERMLWLNPSDNQGARFLIDHVRAHSVWEDHRDAQ